MGVLAMAENKVTINTVVILGAIRMEFVGEEGEKVLGVRVWYSFVRAQPSDREVGSVPANAWFRGDDTWPKYKALAGQYPVFAELQEVRRSTNKGVVIGASDFDILPGDPRISAPVLAGAR